MFDHDFDRRRSKRNRNQLLLLSISDVCQTCEKAICGIDLIEYLCKIDSAIFFLFFFSFYSNIVRSPLVMFDARHKHGHIEKYNTLEKRLPTQHTL